MAKIESTFVKIGTDFDRSDDVRAFESHLGITNYDAFAILARLRIWAFRETEDGVVPKQRVEHFELFALGITDEVRQRIIPNSQRGAILKGLKDLAFVHERAGDLVVTSWQQDTMAVLKRREAARLAREAKKAERMNGHAKEIET